MKKNKIFFCIPNFNVGGAERVIINLFKEFNDQDNYLLVLNKQGDLQIDKSNTDKIISLEKHRSRNSFISLIKIFNREKPKIVISSIAFILGFELLIDI